LWYVVPAILHRGQRHRLQAEKGGQRKPLRGDAFTWTQTRHTGQAPQIWALHRWRL
jgi:hypothetical protein